MVAERLEASTRKELYISLLGKSQTFHDRQRVGNMMAIATDDVQMINLMISPGMLFISDILLGFGIPIIVIGSINVQLLLTPVIFIVSYYVTVRCYSRRLNPVTYQAAQPVRQDERRRRRDDLRHRDRQGERARSLSSGASSAATPVCFAATSSSRGSSRRATCRS